jgi:tight adherence protein B
MAAKRLKLFTSQFPDAIDLIVRGLKSGLPVTESISAVGHEMQDPVGFEFRHIFDCVKFGQPIEEALWDTARRLDTPEFKFFVISISVQRETGGNLSEALGNLSNILRRRRQMGLKIKAMSSEAKASAIILGSLPFIMFGIIFAMNPDYEMVLFNDPRGQMMLGVGLGVMSTGILVMNKMVRFEI